MIAPDIEKDSSVYYEKTSSWVGSFKYRAGNYQRNVYHSHSYAINQKDLVYTVPAGFPQGSSVSVTAQFAEIYHKKPDARVFNVLFNNLVVERSLDVWKKKEELGAGYDITRIMEVPASGNIEIRVQPIVENAMISGIVVVENAPNQDTNFIGGGGENTGNQDTATGGTTGPGEEGNRGQNNTGIGPVIGSGSWRIVDTGNSQPARRHENCAVMCGGKVYLIGGRGYRAVSVLDPKSRTWQNKRVPPVEMNHMQCISWKDRYIYVVGAWYGKYPREISHEFTWIYDTFNDSWEKEPGLPLTRRRGGGALVLHEGKLYLGMGNQGGHGAHATSVGFLDVYDLNNKQAGWKPLASAPDPRDHVAGGLLPGGYFCIGAGRNGGVKNFWGSPVLPVNCYKIATNTWERRANIPEGRGGASTGVTCEGFLMMAGGEGRDIGKTYGGKAYDRVDLYDVRTDTFLTPSKLLHARHGSGLAVADCSCGNIYLPSGSGNLGGGNPDLGTTEVWNLDGAVKNC